jgi:hypothetical protein
MRAPFVKDAAPIERGMKKNGTWVEPPWKGVLDFECQSWSQCWKAWLWTVAWNGDILTLNLGLYAILSETYAAYY